MALRDDIPALLNHINMNADYLAFNKILFDIYEGQVKKYIEQDLEQHFTPQSFEQIKARIAPINLTRRITDKLSQIYQQNPSREVVDGSESDKELLAWYEQKTSADFKLNFSNEFFNLFRACLIQPYVHKKTPKFRSIPNDRFLVYSDDEIDPIEPTHVIIIQDEMTRLVKGSKDEYETVTIYHAYTDEEFIIFNSKGEYESGMMSDLGNEDGVNVFGKIPFIYVNRSSNLLIPKAAQDDLCMTKLIPILMSDLNYATMYQAFSIVYGIDINDEKLEQTPNALWLFKSDPNNDKTPQIGSIKPQVDIQPVLSLIQAQLSIYLETKGIKAGSMGQVTGDNLASGIAKIVDEMDTHEDRQKQTVYFSNAEVDLWDLTLNHMHPVWSNDGLVENKTMFTPTARVHTSFSKQLPLTDRSAIVDGIEKEIRLGLMTKKEAIKKLEPHLSDKEIEQKMLEIEQETSIIIEEEPEQMDPSIDEVDDASQTPEDRP